MMSDLIRTMVVAMSVIALCCDVFASSAVVDGSAARLVGKKTRRKSSTTKPIASSPTCADLTDYLGLSKRLCAFFKAQITATKDYSHRLDAALAYELLSYRSQCDSRRLQRLLSGIKKLALWESDLNAFSKFGDDKKYFTGLMTLSLFCSGLTPDTFPDLSMLKIKKLTLYYCNIDVPTSKLPPTIEELCFDCSLEMAAFPLGLVFLMPNLKKLDVRSTSIPQRHGVVFNVTTGDPIDVRWSRLASDAAAAASGSGDADDTEFIFL